MKISLKLLTAALLCICAAALTVSCVPEEENKWEGTKLVVKDWPEGVSRITLKADNSTWRLNLEEAKEVMAYEYFTGNTVITIYYDTLSDNEKDKYFGYGIRTDSKKPFKVFINSEEAENEAPLAETNLGWETVQVNARTDFRTSFNITGTKTVELTFENAPEKILNKDLRLSDETIYAYIDTSTLLQNFEPVTVWERKQSTGNLTELEYLGYRNNGIYVFNRYTPEFYVDLRVKENYYISADDFDADVPVDVTVDNMKTDYLRHIKFTFKSPSAPYVKAGTIIKLSGGTITAYDVSNFAGKSLVFSENITGVNDLITSAALTLTDNSSISAVSDPIVNLAGGRTFFLTIDGTSWRGTWVATGFDIENRPVIKLYSPAVGDDGQSFEAELVYYNGQLNYTPGPCWSFSANIGEFEYRFIFKLASAQ
ncbi:MAG: hypothetical protein IJJ70_07645 [Treponema sp.]|nr:hypothetical protein [Treponema sp.]MBR0487554.1 hypothetical protein [Treponema sp.]